MRAVALKSASPHQQPKSWLLHGRLTLDHIRLQVPEDSVGKGHDEHTAVWDVFSLEITAARGTPINKLKPNVNLINPYMESSPQNSISSEARLDGKHWNMLPGRWQSHHP